MAALQDARSAMSPGQFDKVRSAIAEANGQDPRSITVAGVRGPQDLVMGERAVHWLLAMEPGSSKEQRIAAKAHHFRRWTRPRSDYPDGRAGYLRWRKDARVAHSVAISRIMAAAAVPPGAIKTVTDLIEKVGVTATAQQEGLPIQAHEDAICLTFLEAQLDSTADQLGDDETVRILVRTLAKMSPRAQQMVTTLELTPAGHQLVALALGQVAERT